MPPHSLPLPLRSAPRLPSLTRSPLPLRLTQPVTEHIPRHQLSERLQQGQDRLHLVGQPAVVELILLVMELLPRRRLPVAASISAKPRSASAASIPSRPRSASATSTWCLPQPRRPARRAGRLVRRPDGGGGDVRADKLVGYLAGHRFVVRLLRGIVLGPIVWVES